MSDVLYSRDDGTMLAKWPDGSSIEVRATNGNPNHLGGQHTNGPPPYWWRESGEGWARSFDHSAMTVRDMWLLVTSGLSRRALGNILMAGGAR